jgi:hypothetical protein
MKYFHASATGDFLLDGSWLIINVSHITYVFSFFFFVLVNDFRTSFIFLWLCLYALRTVSSSLNKYEVRFCFHYLKSTLENSTLNE